MRASRFFQWFRKDEERNSFWHEQSIGSWHHCPQAVLLTCGRPSGRHCLCCSHPGLPSPGDGQSQIHPHPALCRKTLLALVLGSPWPWDEPLNSATVTPTSLKLFKPHVDLRVLYTFLRKGSTYFTDFLKGPMGHPSKDLHVFCIWKISKQTSHLHQREQVLVKKWPFW